MNEVKIEVMLDKNEARIVTLLNLMDVLAQDVKSRFKPMSRGHNAIVAAHEKILEADKCVKGAVKDEFIEHCERYLAKVQLALDGFWDEVTEQDMLDIRKARESTGLAPEVPA